MSAVWSGQRDLDNLLSSGALKKMHFCWKQHSQSRQHRSKAEVSSGTGDLHGELEKTFYFYVTLFPHLQNEDLVPHPGLPLLCKDL